MYDHPDAFDMTVRPDPSNRPAFNFPVLWQVAVLVLSVFLLYGRVIGYPYTEWDDGQYVVDNAVLKAVAQGNWCPVFTDEVMGNYHPVTMLSFAIEEVLFGGSPAARHTTNLILHALNALLVLVLIRRITDNASWAFVTALLWAIHPMHVENVAWVSARKDLLMALFGLASLIGWMRWRGEGSLTRYVMVAALFVLACLSKASAVAFAPSMLLIDVWQGRRWRSRATWLPLLPMIFLAVVLGLVSVLAQQRIGVINNAPLPAADRFMVGAANLVFYLFQQFVPVGSSVFYAYPNGGGALPAYYPLMAFFAIAMVAAFVLIRKWRSGWVAFAFWFVVVHLVLVLQWLPVGEAIRADRYTYIAGIGAMLVMAIALHHFLRSGATFALGFAIPVLAFAFVTWERTPVWSSPESIWSEMIDDEPHRYFHLIDRSVTLERSGRYVDALRDLDAAVRKGGKDQRPRYERARFRIRREEYREAMADLLKIFSTTPREPGLLANMIYVQMKMGMCSDVIGNATGALQVAPGSPDILNMRAYCLLRLSRPEEAWSDIQRSTAIRDQYGELSFLRGWYYMQIGDTAAACTELLRSRSETFSETDLGMQRDSLIQRACPLE